MGFSADWQEGDGTAGVYITAEGIHWWYTPAGDGGRFGSVGQSQTFAEYLENGPIGYPAPEVVISGLHAALRAAGHFGNGPRKPQADSPDLKAYDRWLREKSGE